ncbi:hypothetical protein F4810DRAFT_711807 [Camillea tinctor]|nr:hypothetical protein F4810DRAFT_711807 [Camillea tinctor]
MFWLIIQALISFLDDCVCFLIDLINFGRERKIQHQEDAATHIPEGLENSHPLIAVEKPAKLEYARRMLIFDFRDTSEVGIDRAVAFIHDGFEYAFQHYPFLSGRLGPLANDIKGNQVQLRYGNGKAYPWPWSHPGIFKWRLHVETEPNYAFLCARGMPVSHWKVGDFCAAPESFELGDWPQALTIQANFMMEGALVICLAYMKCVADDVCIQRFLERFAFGIGDAAIAPNPDAPGLDNHFEPEDAKNYNDFPGGGPTNNLSVEREIGARGFREAFMYTIPARRIESCKTRVDASLRRAGVMRSVSTIEVIYAMIWAEATKARCCPARAGKPLKSTRCSVDVNARGRLKPALEKFYFGNMTARAVAQCDIEEFIPTRKPAHYPDHDAVVCSTAALRIHHAIKAIDNTHIQRRISTAQDDEPPPREEHDQTRRFKAGEDVKLTSLETFCADTHFGIPGIRVPWVAEEGAAYILPRRAGHEANWEVLVCLEFPSSRELLRASRLGQWAFSVTPDGDPTGYHRYSRWFGGQQPG